MRISKSRVIFSFPGFYWLSWIDRFRNHNFIAHVNSYNELYIKWLRVRGGIKALALMALCSTMSNAFGAFQTTGPFSFTWVSFYTLSFSKGFVTVLVALVLSKPGCQKRFGNFWPGSLHRSVWLFLLQVKRGLTRRFRSLREGFDFCFSLCFTFTVFKKEDRVCSYLHSLGHLHTCL